MTLEKMNIFKMYIWDRLYNTDYKLENIKIHSIIKLYKFNSYGIMPDIENEYKLSFSSKENDNSSFTKITFLLKGSEINNIELRYNRELKFKSL